MRYNYQFLLIIILLTIFISGCDNNTVYNTIIDLDSNAWNEKTELVYDVKIEDTSSKYTLYYLVRYDDSYPFYNLYINRVIEDSSGKFINKKLQGMDLFKPSTGVPYGDGIGTIKDYAIISEENFMFPYKGKFIFKMKQYMRQESIQGISAIGFKVEKVAQQ